MKSICVFCGNNSSNDTRIMEMAKELGKTLAQKGITLIYGGAKQGLMGATAQACLENNGQVVGVIPTVLKHREFAHPNLTEIIVCETMHERKNTMYNRSEGFIALPGGYGTLDETFEVLTWRQIGLHKKPIGLLNVDGFYDDLQSLFDKMVKVKLLASENRKIPLFHHEVNGLLELMHQQGTDKILCGEA